MSSWAILAPDPIAPVACLDAPPSFSVIIAAYQVADLVGEAIRSVLDQTRPPLEVIVVDDGSTDDLERAVQPFEPHIVFLTREHRGAAATMNSGAEAAVGDYVSFIGADDVWDPRRLEAMGDLAAARPDLDVLTTDSWVSVNGEVFRRFNDETFPFPAENQRQVIFERDFVFGHTAVRREAFAAVGGFNESIRWTSDWELWSRMILGGSAIGSVDEPLATYRLHERSLSNKRLQQARGRLMTFGQILEHPSLTPAEHQEVQQRADDTRREIAWREAKEALLDRTAGAQTQSLRVFADAKQRPAIRVQALVAGAAPGLAARVVARRRERVWNAAGGLQFRRS